MSKEAYEVWRSGLLPTHTLDEIVQAMDTTHLSLRTHAHSHRLEMPGHTIGLRIEMLQHRDEQDLTRKDLATVYRMPYNECAVITAPLCPKYLYTETIPTEQQDAEIKELLDQGISQVAIAEELGVTKYIVQTARKRLGLGYVNKMPKRLSKEDRAALIQDKEAGMSIEALMKKYNVSRPTVFNIWRAR